jgi:hypothetical protein
MQYSIIYMYYPLHSSYMFPNGIKEKYMFVNKELITITVVPSRPDRTHTPQVQNYTAKHQPSIRKNICESLQVISVNHNSVLPDDGSHKIRNMLE